MGRRLVGFLRAHPVFCLLLLSPGIPEYLSSSSPVNAVVLNPFLFLFQGALNLGLYGPGVLLIREASVRWGKGWATVLTLGIAYAILEEGVALSTLFNPHAGPVGTLGSYGHWMGVNWVWTAGLLQFHAVYSIALPILLLGLALPETRGRPLLSRNGSGIAYIILVVDVLVLMAFVVFDERFWLGAPLLAGSLAAIVALVVVARRLPVDFFRPRSGPIAAGPMRLAVLGGALFPAWRLTQGIAESVRLPAVVAVVAVIAVGFALLLLVRRSLGPTPHAQAIVALSAGLLLPIAVFGLVAEISFPLVLIADIAAFLFLRKLWGRNRSPIPRDVSFRADPAR